MGSSTAPSSSCRFHHAMHPEPAHKGIEPTGARSFLRVHPESVATLFIKMEFNGALRSLPAFDESEACVPEKGVVGSQGDEQWRRVGRHLDRRERAVDVADEGGLGILAGQCCCHGQRRAGGKANRSEEHTSELQSHSFISYAGF